MNFSARRYANAVVLRVEGRLDQDTCEAFRADLVSHVEESAHGGGAIVLDLSGLEYVSSAGLRCFMLASRQAKTQ
jgi:anti-anti-sigma factor